MTSADAIASMWARRMHLTPRRTPVAPDNRHGAVRGFGTITQVTLFIVLSSKRPQAAAATFCCCGDGGSLGTVSSWHRPSAACGVSLATKTS